MTRPHVRVLLVDDDEGDALLTRELLRQASVLRGGPFEVRWMDRYDAGVEAARTGRYDLVLVDYRLNPGNGVDLIREARQAGCVTPFILLTGMDDPDVDAQALDAGASDFLAKGATDARLLERSIRYSLSQARVLADLAARTRELQRSNLELEQFARAVSHDLRQPLHIIAGYAEMVALRCDEALDEKARQMISRILSSVERMNGMIVDLMELSKLDLKGDNPLLPVDCGAVVGRVLAEYQGRVEATGAVVEVGALPVVAGRMAHIEQLFRNLVGNALKFVGDAPPRIVLACDTYGDSWRFDVSDNGIGVPESMRRTLFEPFVRGDHEKSYPGLGMGLALCAKIVQQHGGCIWVESNHPCGARFVFTLPRDRQVNPPRA